MSDWDARAHRAAVLRLEALERVNEAIVVGDTPEPDVAAELASMPCGGCNDCTAREVLHAAMPVLMQAVLAGDLTRTEMRGWARQVG